MSITHSGRFAGNFKLYLAAKTAALVDLFASHVASPCSIKPVSMGCILPIGRRCLNDCPSGAVARTSGEKWMDALSDVLRAVRLTGAIFFDIQASEPWVAETDRKSVV